MSLVEDLGAQLRATADDLPMDLLRHAVERLHGAVETLQSVRQASASPLGVPELGAAAEHVEHAAYAVRAAQDALSGYVATALGLGAPGGPAAGGERRRRQRVEPEPARPAAEPEPAALAPGWWPARVDELTGYDPAPATRDDGSGASSGEQLLRRVADRVRGGDRAGLRGDLRTANPAVGLSLGGLAAPAAHRMATRLLGRPPRADDLPRLRRETESEVRGMLPGLPDTVVGTLLARTCRAPAPAGDQAHPADSAVAAAVLATILLRRAGGEGRDLDEPQPAHA
ncbi:MAG TPA: hypothetical protein VFR67_21980 [Pilimelia sp.]|nr:hypothetical protein [Pilimelia sp.]